MAPPAPWVCASAVRGAVSLAGEVTAVARLCRLKVVALSGGSRDLSVPRKASDGVRHQGEEIRISELSAAFLFSL